MPQKPATRELIVEATISCIEKYGLEKVTTRRIAQAAGTNIASINYHFHSKDALITETLALTINHMLGDVTLALADTRKPFEVTLREVFRYIVEGSWRFPGLSKAHLTQAVVGDQKDAVGARAMVRVFNGLADRAALAYPRKNPQLLRLRLVQVMSSMLFLVLAPGFFSGSSRRRKPDGLQAEQYADSFATLFLRGI
jgi:AcrR family transcriptional regulator